MRMKRLLAAAPALAAQAFYAIGHAVVGTFLTNTRIVGIRDSRIKEPLIAANVIGWPLVGLASALLARRQKAEGRRQKAESSSRPYAAFCLLPSAFCLWRVAFTVIGARYVMQEVYGWLHPRPCPPELVMEGSQVIDLHEEIA